MLSMARFAGFMQSPGSLEKSLKNREGLSKTGKVFEKKKFCLAEHGKVLEFFRSEQHGQPRKAQ